MPDAQPHKANAIESATTNVATKTDARFIEISLLGTNKHALPADLVFAPTLAHWNQARNADIVLSFVQPYVA